jgi:hypothetical protein
MRSLRGADQLSKVSPSLAFTARRLSSSCGDDRLDATVRRSTEARHQHQAWRRKIQDPTPSVVPNAHAAVQSRRSCDGDTTRSSRVTGRGAAPLTPARAAPAVPRRGRSAMATGARAFCAVAREVRGKSRAQRRRAPLRKRRRARARGMRQEPRATAASPATETAPRSSLANFGTGHCCTSD